MPPSDSSATLIGPQPTYSMPARTATTKVAITLTRALDTYLLSLEDLELGIPCENRLSRRATRIEVHQRDVREW